METGIPGFLYEELEEWEKEENWLKSPSWSSFYRDGVVPLLEEELMFGGFEKVEEKD